LATVNTATTNFDRTVTALVLATIRENLRNRLVWMQDGAYIPGHLIPGTNLIRHIAYGDMSVVAGTPTPGTPPWLNEGVPPTEEALTIYYDEYGVNQAGRLIAITDVAMAESPHALASVAAERAAFNALATIDLAIAGVVGASTAVRYVTGAAARINITTAMKLTGDEVRRTVSAMKVANIPTFPDGNYRAMIHPNATYDLQSDTAVGGWLEASKYAAPDQLLSGEIGRYFGVRFIESNLGTVFLDAGATSADVYNTTFYGPEYFAFGDLQSVTAYMQSPGGDHADPLAQKAQVGWKAMWGAKVLTATGTGPRLLRLETGGTIVIP
jgi:N4-gp56 family major capsid protein